MPLGASCVPGKQALQGEIVTLKLRGEIPWAGWAGGCCGRCWFGSQVWFGLVGGWGVGGGVFAPGAGFGLVVGGPGGSVGFLLAGPGFMDVAAKSAAHRDARV